MKKQILFAVLLLYFSGCTYNEIQYDGAPDLIIESAKVDVKYEDGYDQFGMPKRSDKKILEITIRIKNTGRKPFHSLLFVASTTSEHDFNLNYFNDFTLIHPDPVYLRPDETIEYKVTRRVDVNSKNMKLRVNHHSDLDKIAKESDYFNNTYSIGI